MFWRFTKVQRVLKVIQTTSQSLNWKSRLPIYIQVFLAIPKLLHWSFILKLYSGAVDDIYYKSKSIKTSILNSLVCCTYQFLGWIRYKMEEKDKQKTDVWVISLRNLISIGLVNDKFVLKKSHSLCCFHCSRSNVFIVYFPVV